MAIVRAVKTGNWSDTTAWNTGALPTSSDDVYSNTYTVTIDTSPTVLSIRNSSTTGVTAGGGFTISTNGITLTADVVAGGTTCLVVSVGSGSSASVVGNCTGGNTGSNNHGISNTSTGTLNITGNCTAGASGTANNNGANNASTGTLNITGNCTAPTSSASHGANNASTGTLNITGNCTGASNATGYAANNASTGTLNITGTITGGANATGYGALNASTGTLTHVGIAQASTSTAAIGPGASGQVTTLTGPLISTSTTEGSAAASGVNPVIALRWFPADTALTTFTCTMRGATVAGSPSSRPARVLSLPDATANAYPAVSNVRSGTVYGVGNAYTGTCAVPGAASVLVGVPVDATTGTAVVSAADIRSAIGLASANLDTQLSGKPTAAQIRTELSTELGRIDATISSRLASSSYTAPLDAAGTRSAVGLATANLDTQLSGIAASSAPSAAAIRAEMDSNSTKLANLDATVSSRSTYAGGDTSGTTTLLSRLSSTRAGYLDNLSTAPPSAADIAAAVWAAATRTLTTAIDNSATIAAAVWAYATGSTITGGTVDTLTNAPSVPSAATIASQVRTELSTELSRIDATVSSRLASSAYTAPTTPPTAAQNATAVRTELSTELGRLDAAVSSRLAPSGTLARVTLTDTATTLTNAPTVPTPEEIAAEVRSELEPELERVANCATVETTGDQLAAFDG